MKKVLTVVIIVLLIIVSTYKAEGSAKFELNMTHYHSYEELTEILQQFVNAYPKFLKLESMGKSYQGRDLWVVTINNPETGAARNKAAMYIHANIHGNEIQGSEVCLYTIWYLMENYQKIDNITELVDSRVFYITPTVNPDGRAYWFDFPNNSNSSRSGQKPTDNDQDWRFDEDGYDDLDGDGEIVQMRKLDREGRFKIDPQDSRMMIRVSDDEPGEYTYLGSEGIDNDGDGRVNEDGAGGYDPNRNFPCDWQPNYIQYGADDYPLSLPESQAIAQFLMTHPNIAGVQGYHNAGGMILRGPGSKNYGNYLNEDIKVYDHLGKKGEKILPFYHYMIIGEDLYTVYGGFITWAYEDLGIFSFTNELFSTAQYFNQEIKGDWQERFYREDRDRMFFNDFLEFNSMFIPWKPFQHPTYGEIEIGGWKKFSHRIDPEFLLPEVCHRNCAFTLFHADQMPIPEFAELKINKLKSDLYRIQVGITNKKMIPTISKQAQQHQLYRPDILTIKGDRIKVISGGIVTDKWQGTVTRVKVRPDRMIFKEGLWFKEIKRIEWIVAGSGKVSLCLDCLKGGIIQKQLELK